MAFRVLLADDHQIVRQGFRALLERDGIDVVAEAADGMEAVRLAGADRPDVIVLDLSMPRLNGLDAARAILRDRPGSNVVPLTMHMEEHQVTAALRALGDGTDPVCGAAGVSVWRRGCPPGGRQSLARRAGGATR